MSVAERHPACDTAPPSERVAQRIGGLRALIEGSKSAVPRHWLALNDDQRWAICATATRRFGLHLPRGTLDEMTRSPLADPRWGRDGREALRCAVIALGVQEWFGSDMAASSWHPAFASPPAEAPRPSGTLQQARASLQKLNAHHC